MATLLRNVQRAAAGLMAVVGISLAVSAQILIVDDDRVEREAAAYKDFNLQTSDIRNGIIQRRQFISRGGALEQQLAELEKQKSIIGNDKYEGEKKKLEGAFVQAQRELQVLEYNFDRLRQEAMVQVERARQPVIRNLLAARKAQVIMVKRLVLGNATGTDVTTEFIEQLDSELPSVSLSMGEAPAAAPAAKAPEKKQ